MYEQRLISIGFPISEAVSICNSMLREGEDVERFIREQEQTARGTEANRNASLPFASQR